VELGGEEMVGRLFFGRGCRASGAVGDRREDLWVAMPGLGPDLVDSALEGDVDDEGVGVLDLPPIRNNAQVFGERLLNRIVLAAGDEGLGDVVGTQATLQRAFDSRIVSAATDPPRSR
jgi:hypothetical protein